MQSRQPVNFPLPIVNNRSEPTKTVEQLATIDPTLYEIILLFILLLLFTIYVAVGLNPFAFRLRFLGLTFLP